ncbi:MAG TPA: hypothetical protein VMH61_07625 [Candidatus Acidoferrales bacterium]|nr:hypothetical protein [Candidatus Acidoferrales bacterium]
MRSVGSRRGNSVLFASIEQASRRRWAALDPHAGGPAAPRDAREDQRWTRAFFERIRDSLLPRMAPALEIDGAELRYFGSERLTLWAVSAPHALVLAYEHGDTPELLRERSSRWLACLRTRTAPGLVTPHWGHPVYGARLDPANDELDVVWATPGDWCGFVLDEAPAPRGWNAPLHWDDALTARS